MGGLSLTMLEEVRRRSIPATAFVHDEWLDYGRWADGWLRTFTGPRRGRLAPLAERVSGIPARVALGRAAEYVFVSEFTRRRAHELGLELQSTSVAHSGIDPAFLEPGPEQDWRWRLLYVGRLDARKGVDTAIRALSELPPDARLTIAGGWDELEERRLRTMAAEAGDGDRVHFTGQVGQPELLRMYAECDAVVFPVRWDEPWGLVPLEAMARERPVIATGRGGSGEYLRDGENCLLFDAESPSGLAGAVKRLADDPDLRARLREGGLATAPHYTERVLNKAVEGALTRVVDHARRGVRNRPMKVLHIGSGFRPLRTGGLVAYVEGLMDEQVRRGTDVTYLFTGRYYPWSRRPRLRRWRRGAVKMLEVVGSPLYDHGFQPRIELTEPQLEQLVSDALAEVGADLVHVHELAGLPTSVLDLLHRSGTATVMTLQDYYALCPTFKLLDFEGRVCLRREIGADCVATVATDRRPAGLLHHAAVRHDIVSSPVLRRLVRSERMRDLVATWISRAARRRDRDGSTDPAAYQRRRDVNIARLNRVDRLLAMSDRVREIYEELGTEPGRLSTEQLTLPHITKLRPRRARVGGPVVFATLGGGESEAKGARVLLDAMGALSDLAISGRFRLLILGNVADHIAGEARDVAGVELPGRFASHEQDAVLDPVDVGIVPSTWEEAYAYAGVEFLAKGIPVIGNAIGGIVDYVRDGETGWLNHSRTAEELARIMRTIIEQPSQIVELNERLRADRSHIVLPMPQHAQATEDLYRDVLAEREAASVTAAGPTT